MCDEWMPTIRLPVTREQFQQLPRNPAYKYEFANGQAILSPRGKHYHAICELQRMPVPAGWSIQPAKLEDYEEMASVFVETFRGIQPFGSLDEGTFKLAAHRVLERTRTGGDGPWIQQASFVARRDAKMLGAILITLLPEGDPCEWDSYGWQEPPPADCIERRSGQPHLTWVFVTPWDSGRGLGTALLATAGNKLLEMGFSQLLSTFMLGNDSSMLWHWRNGFKLLAYPGSMRRMKKALGL